MLDWRETEGAKAHRHKVGSGAGRRVESGVMESWGRGMGAMTNDQAPMTRRKWQRGKGVEEWSTGVLE